MGIIKFKEANCKSCYKCIRACDLKAISFSHDQAQIIEDECILCGKCTLSCPQNSKEVLSDLPTVSLLLTGDSPVYASVSPAYVAAFPNIGFSAISAALKQLGFAGVYDASFGAQLVLEEYLRLSAASDGAQNIITTSCPACTLLVEKYYPHLVEYLAPVLSPAEAHAKSLRAQLGQDVKIVYIGSCIAQKKDAQGGILDGVLTFDQLQELFRNHAVIPGAPDPDCAPFGCKSGSIFYLPGGIISGMGDSLSHFKTVSADGLSRCISTLDSLKDDKLSGYFVELYCCAGACVQGPGMYRHRSMPYLLAKDLLLNTTTVGSLPSEKTCDISALHSSHALELPLPTETQISAILSKMVAATGGGLLNCGSCGYATCREKAIAIFQGKADMDMCLPYMRQRAESMSNVILEYTPNAVFLVDENYNIIQHNPAADKLFSCHGHSMVGAPISRYLYLNGFDKLKNSGKPIIEELSATASGNLTVRQSILSVPHGDILVILKDVTAEQENMAAITKLRTETLNITQTIIDKQMRSAQEIASLLGETTGETKAALVKLKKALKEGGSL